MLVIVRQLHRADITANESNAYERSPGLAIVKSLDGAHLTNGRRQCTQNLTREAGLSSSASGSEAEYLQSVEVIPEPIEATE